MYLDFVDSIVHYGLLNKYISKSSVPPRPWHDNMTCHHSLNGNLKEIMERKQQNCEAMHTFLACDRPVLKRTVSKILKWVKKDPYSMTLLQSTLPITSRLFSLQYYILTANDSTFQLKWIRVRNVFVLWGKGLGGSGGKLLPNIPLLAIYMFWLCAF